MPSNLLHPFSRKEISLEEIEFKNIGVTDPYRALSILNFSFPHILEGETPFRFPRIIIKRSRKNLYWQKIRLIYDDLSFY